MLANPSQTVTEANASPASDESDALLERLETAFRQSFVVLSPSTGTVERINGDWLGLDIDRLMPRFDHRCGEVEVLEDHAPLLVLAVRLPTPELMPTRVAVTTLLTDADPSEEALASAAHRLGLNAQRLANWARGRHHWPAHAALALAGSMCQVGTAEQLALRAKAQESETSAQLIATFEELNLMHQLTEGLSIGRSEVELTEQAVGWLSEVIPTDCVVACLDIADSSGPMVAGHRLPVEAEDLSAFFERLGPQAERRAIVLNRDRTSSPTWAYPEVREVVTAPIIANDRRIGWLAVLNYRAKRYATERDLAGEFGPVEASLLSSVATLIGVHAGNQRLYVEKTELFDSAVHAMTSAIDAKDRYTCGHSDRVARVAVRLAQELDCTDEEVNAIYLGGLMHDIGKIGIEDTVLRKPGKLTDEEYEHIKTHPSLGEQILRGVPQLSHVLPIVLHHHEAWDGTGYPGGLVRDECPLLARIMAVADAFDAMGSDRPYRKGMPIEKVEAILKDGAGKQWDARIVDAYFAAREDIAAISRLEREPLDLDVSRWSAEPLVQ